MQTESGILDVRLQPVDKSTSKSDNTNARNIVAGP